LIGNSDESYMENGKGQGNPFGFAKGLEAMALCCKGQGEAVQVKRTKAHGVRLKEIQNG
jgi:hypothetical protein